MDKLRRKIDHIHYVNNLWHLSLNLRDYEMASFFKKRKVILQLEVIEENRQDVRLVFDDEAERTKGDILLIRLKNHAANACHISRDELMPDMIKELLN